MTRYILRTHTIGENSKIDAFLAEIRAICIKHGMAIEHEDGHGAFLITDISERALEWLEHADDCTRQAAAAAGQVVGWSDYLK